jgi:uncharacterized membrane protein YgdD (TMEM256/DUF423 family)
MIERHEIRRKTTMTRHFIVIAGILGALGVALGAFGAHGLESTLVENGRTDTFQTASRYHIRLM